MRQETLKEYETRLRMPLSPQECDTLRRVSPSIRVAPSIGAVGHYDVTPGSWVGAINLGTLAIDVQPKLEIAQVLFLLSYSLHSTRWQDVGFDFAQHDSLLEAIIPGFIAQIRRALRGGLLHGYRSEEDSLTTIRGRIRFNDQIRKRFGIVLPVEVQYDDFTEDIEENRLIKAAISRLGRMRIRSDTARQQLRAFDALLGSVSLVDYLPNSLPSVSYTRLNDHYRPAVELAKLILRASSYHLAHGVVHASAFLVDMNEVFENFVVLALREALGLSERAFPQNCRGRELRLDRERRIDLQPDLSWWEDSTCVFVGDVKYKRVNAEGIKHPDLYQLLAYTVAAALPSGLLVYAHGEDEPSIHTMVYLDRKLEVASLDLRGQPQAALAQVNELASRIRQIRHYVIERPSVLA